MNRNTARRVNNVASIERSGNSDVDVFVTVDTSALAYALASYLYADGRLDETQYRNMLGELEQNIQPRGCQSRRDIQWEVNEW